MNTSYNILLGKLDEFTRKYYLNQIIKGSLWCTGILGGLFITAALLENFVFENLQPSAAVGPRKAIFWGFMAISASSLVGLMGVPLFKYFKLGKLISHEFAAEIIGNHFGEVKDKLLNVLQLQRQTEAVSTEDNTLVMASINQKISEMRPVPFKNAIDLEKNRRFLPWVLPPVGLLLFLLIAAPSFITGSASRLINNSKEYEPQAPFSFVLDNVNPQVVQFSDYELLVKIEGEEMPAEAFIEIDNYSYKLEKKSGNVYSYMFNKVAKDATFRFRGAGVESKSYTLDVLEKPNIANFEVKLSYPSYTGRQNEVLTNIGDLVIPAGTNITWVFNAQHTEQLAFRFGNGGGKMENSERQGREQFIFKKSARADDLYKIFVSNGFLPKADSVAYSLSVIPDQHPTISLERFEDSTDNRRVFMAGDASDDYGISTLNFQYTIERGGQKIKEQSVPIKQGGKQTAYNYELDIRSLELQPGDKLNYFFEVWDNDAVNGRKSSRTQMFNFAMPTTEQMEKQEQQNNSEIKDKLEDAIRKSKELQQEAKKLQDDILQKKELDWQDKKKIENLVKEQKQLENMIQEAQQNMQENLKNQKEFQKPNEELIKKQEQLEKLFENVLDEETKELFRKMEELLKEMDKKELVEKLEDMKLNEDQMNKELDRMMEMFKQLEMEKDMKDAIDKLNDLAKKQEELSKEAEEGKKTDEELEKKQEELNKEFEKVQEKLDDAEKKNEELENKQDMPDTKQQEEDIKKEMNNTAKQLQKQQKKDASKSGKKAADKMKDMANSLAQAMQKMEEEQMEEDMAAMRQLLENLVGMSYDQEKLMDQVNSTEINTPSYTKLVQGQYKLKDDFRIIEDSLQALSKRVYQIESFVTDKVKDVKKNINSSIKDLEERQKQVAQTHQQYTMTNVNDLALMLSETLEQMQMQQSMSKPGEQMCQKPGGKKPNKGGKPSSKGMGEMQKKLGEQMKQMQKGMQDGKLPGNMSKQFAQMAAQQAALRKALQDLKNQRQQEGKGGQGGKQLQEMIDGMDKIEAELVNKKLTNETLKRQEEILTRLLEHEKAEREREQDPTRESKSGQDQQHRVPPAFEEYIRKRQAQIDMYKTVSPDLKPFYKNLVKGYFDSLK